ncbi:vasoactive intestinal polypeptide receptor-like [Callorhinchus milii]|uniref:vasoactive intestinal polypeptide receptor-like n=1 Tax=Callorhinchus milii TaxID=7868 RepID=UPI001C3FEF9B|nr:vasoactive intestinal polypeptide receptor-like [Callorhinchus milii]
MQADCELLLEFQEGAERCRAMDIATNMSAARWHLGCRSKWDNVSCWPASAIGEIVVLPCPRFPSLFTRTTGNISRRCTSEGWTDLFTSYSAACGYNPNNTEPDVKEAFLERVKLSYTVGHSLSLIFLTVALFLLCLFRKLHCTRNYIHINLFLSFILKAVSVFVKDAILFGSETDQCSPSTTSCKVAIAFFHFSVTANFFWLLAEAVYLHTLMAVSFFIDNEHFGSYFAIAWGKGGCPSTTCPSTTCPSTTWAPALITLTWSLVMLHYDDVGCWDSIRSPYFWIIKAPISLTILVNFLLFICIVHILVQKVYSSDNRISECRQYLRLARSTLFLIPLFGVNYMVFVFVPHHLNSYVQLVFDLTLGSFQGSIVATLYCFLNGEVQGELACRWQQCCVQWYLPAKARYGLPPAESSKEGTQLSLVASYSPPIRADNPETGSSLV